MGVGCAVQSYDGKLFFGLIADAHVASDVRRLRDFIRESWQELCQAAGVKKAPRRVVPTPKAQKRQRKPPVAVPVPAMAQPATPAMEPIVLNVKSA